jgi:pyruvate/2-oxoglutarate dehydrogenase complex dihydrolipoamide acyltransferase (E2) component
MTEREADGRKDEELRGQDERAPGGREPEDDTDVVLDVPVLKIEELDLEVEELQAHISARAELAGFLNIDVGVNAYVGQVKLNIKGVEAQVQLKVKLERILGSIDRALAAIEKNPRLIDPDYQEARDAPRQEGQREIPAGAERDGSGPGATDAARKKSGELGVDLSGIEGTGSGGRIIVRDVEKAAKG